MKKRTPKERTIWHKERKSNKTGFLGVTYREKGDVYLARIRKKGEKNKIHIGTSVSAEGAARMYDKKAIELFGEDAVLNFELSATDNVSLEELKKMYRKGNLNYTGEEYDTGRY